MAAQNNTPPGGKKFRVTGTIPADFGTRPIPPPEPAPTSRRVQEKARTEANKKRLSDVDGAYHQGLKLAHASLLGVNLEILKGLEQINFVKGTSGGMTNSAAYLKLWKASTPIATQVGGITPPDSAVTYPNLYNQFKTPTYQKQTFDTNNTFVGKGTSLIKSVPISGPRSDTNLPQVKELPYTSPPIIETPPIAGPVNSANPKSRGFWWSKIRSSVSTTQVTNKSTLLRPSSDSDMGGTATDPLASSVYTSNGIWQFLFNPEEISVQGNAQYNVAEVWGVMDTDGDKNAGQPLQWKNNQNEKLVFSKILLNGYVFGRRVDGLEKGLLDLTRLAQAGNPDGPPVLEFVWGGRKFGPCVIREFNVREKNWDDGMLVNAEISLTLERVPEWIINDGFVDVARPGRQALIDDPTTAVGGGTSEGEKPGDRLNSQQGNDAANGKGGSPQNSQQASMEKFICSQATPAMIYNFSKLRGRVDSDSISFKHLSLFVNPFISKAIDNNISKTYMREYENLFKATSANLGEIFDRQFRGKNSGYTPGPLWEAIKSIDFGKTSPPYIQTDRQKLLITALDTVISGLDGIVKGEKCKKEFESQKKKNICAKVEKKRCSDAVLPKKNGETWTNPCNKKTYQCVNGFLKGPLQ